MGPGRPPARPSIGELRELSRAELDAPRGKVPMINRFRDSHHQMARLFASGMRVSEVAEHTGYSVSRVSLFHTSPAFQQLIAEKRKIVEEVFADRLTAYNDLILSNGMKAERKIADKLDDDDEGEELSVRELISIARDAADRVGLAKKSVQVNANMDFAAMLDRAIQRSGEVLPRSGDLKLVASSSSEQLAPDRGLSPSEPSTVIDHRPSLAPRPFRRRV
jgi:hypothetical protein